jgi:hypothetical protein
MKLFSRILICVFFIWLVELAKFSLEQNHVWNPQANIQFLFQNSKSQTHALMVFHHGFFFFLLRNILSGHARRSELLDISWGRLLGTPGVVLPHSHKMRHGGGYHGQSHCYVSWKDTSPKVPNNFSLQRFFSFLEDNVSFIHTPFFLLA